MVQLLAAKTVGAKLTGQEYKKLQALVDSGAYLNTSDFIREAIREKLEGIEVVKTRDVSYQTAKKEVLGYYSKYREAYPFQAANDLELDYEIVRRVLDELKKEKRVEVIR